jgi:carboxyl-terminal processing protease
MTFLRSKLGFFRALVASLGLCILLVACGGGGGGGGGGASSPSLSGYPNQALNCEIPTQKQWVFDYMKDQYYWYEKMAAGNFNASSPAQFLDSLIYKPTDRYSFAIPTEVLERELGEGQSLGWGDEYMVWADTARTILKFALVEPQSPLGLAGVKRGDQIISIDGRSPQQIVSTGLAEAQTQAEPRNYVIQDAFGTTRPLLLAAKLYNLTPVLSTKVMTLTSTVASAATRTVGYLAYTQFSGGSDLALIQAFSTFSARGVNELVLDLRYNGGGFTSVANTLSSLIGGTRLAGSTFVQFRFNSKYTRDNFSVPFNPPGTALNNLQRLVVITSEDTASASELVINSLRPYIPQVVLVGAKTYGKPYFSAPEDVCGFSYAVILGELFNSAGVGGYANGIAPTCTVADDLTHDFGDPAEQRLAAALKYIETGACPAVAVKASTQEGISFLQPKPKHSWLR